MVRVILRPSDKLSDEYKTDVVLWTYRVYLFRFTAQGPPGAVLPLPSALVSWSSSGLASDCIPRPAENQNSNNGQAQPEAEATVIRQETVVFHEDKDVEHKSISNYVNIGIGLRDSALEDRVHDIKSFLSRPVNCWNGSYQTTSPVGVQLVSMSMPSSCIAKSSYKEKMRGFYGFRAKMVIRVQINGQRFQQGRLLMHYLPEVADMDAERKFTALQNLAAITQQPRMDIDVAFDTEAIMEIPFVSNQLYSSLIDDTGDYGTFYLTPYTALRVGSGAAKCQVSIWCHFEDIEIVYPTIPGLVTQSGIRRKKGRGGSSVGGVDTTDVELNQAGLGPISGLASRISKATGVLSEIPLISAFTAPVSWAANVVSRSAMAMGYSKPAVEGPFARGVPTLWPNMKNIDAVDNSSKLAYSVSNKLEGLPGFAGTDVDEMSFSHLFQIPSYIATINWATGNLTGYQLLSTGIGPAYVGQLLSFPTNSGVVPLRMAPPFAYIANFFKYWRGGITFTFKVVKTEFHSGRLLVAFTPGLNRTSLDTTFDLTQYLYREVFDLRTSNEFSVTIPYTALTPYIATDQSVGNLHVFVLNPLTAPDTVSQTVDVIVECNACHDFEVAGPKGYNSFATGSHPVMLSQCGIRRLRRNIRLKDLRPQGMAPKLATGDDAHGCPSEDSIAQRMDQATLEPAKFCIGERFLSLRQLLKSFTLVSTGVSTTPTTQFSLKPWLSQVYVAVSGAAFTPTTLPTDLYSCFAPLFRYYRGGMRVKVITTVDANFQYWARCSFVDWDSRLVVAGGNGGLNETTDGSKVTGDAPIVINSKMGMYPEVEVPYYGNTHVRHSYNVSPVTKALSSSQLGPTLVITSPSDMKAHRAYRAVADDFAMGFFIGVLPLT